MDNNLKNQGFTMALETGIGGGSISVFKKGRLIDYSPTDFSVLKVDNLIEKISILMNRRNIEKSALDKIIYSEDPGSQIGLKIGAAVAKGLSISLDISIAGRDLFECILKIDEKLKPAESIIILPLNGKFYVWKHFNIAGVCINAGQDKYDEVFEKVSIVNNIYDIRIFTSIKFTVDPLKKALIKTNKEIVDLGDNFSYYLGM